jgi:Flp pilus assembly protein TadG
MLVMLFAMAAIAIDVSSGYSARQAYRTASDASSLAGAQNLQTPGGRAVTATERTNARTDALKSLKQAFNASGTGAGSCDPTTQIANCELSGTPFRVSIKTPSPSCVLCGTGNHAVQVTVSNPTFQLSFSRVLGLDHWNVATTSIAGLGFGQSYALVTLRPPTGSGSIPDVRDIQINGGTHVTIDRGEVGSNANMLYSGSGSKLILDASGDYGMYYYDPFNGPLWSSPPDPVAQPKLTSMILDPGYTIPGRSGGLAGAQDTTTCASVAGTVYSNVQYRPSVPATGAGPDMTKIQCYRPGIYAAEVKVNNGELGIFEPGLYFFDGGLNAQGSVIGGYTQSAAGVAFVFPETQGTMFKNRTGGGSSSLVQLVALNAGTKYNNPAGTEALAARDYSGNPVQTDPAPHLVMTVIVQRDGNCTVTLPLPAACDTNEENRNKAIDLSGGSAIYLAGVQYGASDGMSIAGNSSSGGYIGQIVAWTVFYTGGSVIRQEGPSGPDLGILRLDAACTAPGTPCNP